jgi:hypothetical protein
MKSVKEKANELISIFGKELAPKVVDEIIKTFDCTTPQSIEYWEQVKEELTKQQEQ